MQCLRVVPPHAVRARRLPQVRCCNGGQRGTRGCSRRGRGGAALLLLTLGPVTDVGGHWGEGRLHALGELRFRIDILLAVGLREGRVHSQARPGAVR